jgi:hypothetical protein
LNYLVKFKYLPYKFYIIFFSLTVLGNHAVSQNKTISLTKAQALEDIRWLRLSLDYVHPRLYKYDDKATVDSRFDSLRNTIGNRISGMDFLALVTKANAQVHCGHLYTIAQGDLGKQLSEKKVLPFYVKIVDGKLYLFNDCSNSSIPNGSHVLSINGKNDTEILHAVLPGIPADGYIQTRKLRLLERYFNEGFQGFDLYYYLFADRSVSFQIDYASFGTNLRKTITVKGITSGERREILSQRYDIDERIWFKTPSPAFEIDAKNNYAVLSVSRSFYDEKIDPKFDSQLSTAFSTIKQRQIGNLILDLRNNEGGDEYQQMELMSYLYDKPFRLYQNIYLSHLDFRRLKPVIMERDTAKLLFDNDDEYMRKINENLWINNYEYSSNLKLREPKPNVFKGNIFVLMNGTCFSSAADLIADLKRTTTAVFIGEESGGAFEGPTGGDDIVIQLPNSEIMIRMSPNIQIGYLYEKHPIGRGVLPTYPIEYTVPDLVNHIDLEMEFAKKLIKSKDK